MTYYGTVESFDETKGHGFIKPETTGAHIGFERSAIVGEDKTSPQVGKRLFDGREIEVRPMDNAD
jgi:cold shock CspA family protein